jgi:small subunit ribosomal protein S5
MAKSSKPDRKQRDRKGGRREPTEFEETTLSVDRVTRVVAGGRRMRFRAVVVLGNKKGKVGLGTGKANDVQSAVQKAAADAKRHLIRVPIVNGSLPHEVDMKFKASRIRLLPAKEGTGVIAGSSLRVILEHAGVKNVLSKRYGTSNKLVNAQCAMLALSTLRGGVVEEGEEVLNQSSASANSDSGQDKKKMDDVKVDQAEAARADEDALEGIEIKEISKEDVDLEGNLKGEAI